MAPKPIELKVRELGGNDQYKDMVRVHWRERNNVRNGKIARATVDGRGPFFLAMRGTIAHFLRKGTARNAASATIEILL